MVSFSKLKLSVILSFFFTTHAAETSSLNPYARPYYPAENSRSISMINTHRHGCTIWIPLNKVLELEKTEDTSLETSLPYLESYFWVAVYNNYPTAAYKIGRVLFENILLRNMIPFPNLSDYPTSETSYILSDFFSFLAKSKTGLFSLQDRHCFATHAAKLKPQ